MRAAVANAAFPSMALPTDHIPCTLCEMKERGAGGGELGRGPHSKVVN
jgi:hypothetical protein